MVDKVKIGTHEYVTLERWLRENPGTVLEGLPGVPGDMGGWFVVWEVRGKDNASEWIRLIEHMMRFRNQDQEGRVHRLVALDTETPSQDPVGLLLVSPLVVHKSAGNTEEYKKALDEALHPSVRELKDAAELKYVIDKAFGRHKDPSEFN